ncbi:MAG: DUF11 domain-containing protein [Xanthomonadales bacterium]|nr:DUF11 domain-containing protein [Xanthomonadales bacterium]
MAPTSVLEMEVGGVTVGTQYDRLAVSGSATLDGTLDVFQFGGFTPAPMDVFDFITSPTISGTITLGVNPYPGFTLVTTLASVQFLQPAPLVCTWDGSVGNWNDPTKWLNCAGGGGSTPNTPGPMDTAIANAGQLFVTVPETVDILRIGGTVSFTLNADVLVSSEFDWTGSGVIGPGMLTLDSTSVSTWTGTNRLLVNAASLVNNGMIQQTAAGTTGIASDAQFINAPGASFELAFGGNATVFSTDGSPMALFDNQGSFVMNGTGFLDLTVPFNNNGTVDVNSGFLQMMRAGTDTGQYQIASPGQVTMSAHTRVAAAGSDFVGTGTLQVDNGASLDLQGGFNLNRLNVRFGSSVSWPQAGLLSIPVLSFGEGSSLSTMGPLNCANVLFGTDGRISGVGGVQALTLPLGSTLTLPVAAAGVMTFDDIAVQLDGAGRVNGGTVNLDNGSSMTVGASGVFEFLTNVGSPAQFGCIACGAPTFTNLGITRMNGAALNDDGFINGPIAVDNQGTLDLVSQRLIISNLSQNGATAVTQVSPTGSLGTSFQMQVNGGTLTGNGLIQADINNIGGTIRPGTSPGTLTIDGQLDLNPGSILEMEVGGITPGTQYDQLLITGVANLDGTINVRQFGGFVPGPLDAFSLLSFASATGSLALGVNEVPTHVISQTPTSVVLEPFGGPLIVTTTVDPGDGVCDVAGIGDGCTLREAINAANLDAAADLIAFNIPGPGPHTITPLSPLPPITAETVIDGYSQPGSLANTQLASVGGLNGTLLIELSGAATTGDGLVFAQAMPPLPDGVSETKATRGVSTSGVSGLVINRWSGAGIRIDSDAPGDFVASFGNYIGTSVDGLTVPTPMQGNGIVINNVPGGAFVQIGGQNGEERNLISGNLNHGVLLGGDAVTVQGNLIGTDATGMAPLPNGRRGIFMLTNTQAINAVIGGAVADQRNVISGNLEDGIGLQCAPGTPAACFDGSSIVGNYIGVGVDGIVPMGNANGVNVIDMTFGQVNLGGTAVGLANKIEFNLGAGVRSGVFPVAGGEAVEGRMCISGNIFANNAGPGIDLDGDGRQINDPSDTDAGFNNGQNYPEISNFLPDTPTTGQFAVEYSVDTALTDAAFPMQIEFFRASGDEGFEFLGADSYNPVSPGATQQFILPGSPTITTDDVVIATATDANCKSSEFSYYDVSLDITDDTPDPSLIGNAYPVEVTATPNGPFPLRGDIAVDDGATQMCSISMVAADANVSSCMLGSPPDLASLVLGAFYDDTNQPFGPAFDPDGEPHVVGNPTAFTTFNISPEPSGAGDPYVVDVALTAIVGTPTGSVDVLGTGGEMCSISLVAGAGQCSLNAVTVGAQGVSVSYTPDPTFEAASAMLPHLVDQAASTTLITSDTPDPSAPGASVNVQVSVQPSVVGNILIPSGSVTVMADTGESCVIAALDGSGLGNCSLALNTVGARTLTASYGGDASFLAGMSAGEPHSVVLGPPENTTTVITAATPEPSVVGQPYSVSVQVSGAMGGTPCGTVNVTQLPNSSSCVATLAPTATPGVAGGSCSVTAPNAITKGLLASYTPGACNFASSQSALATHGVNRALTTTSVTQQTPNPSAVGQAVSVQFAVAVVAPGAGTPTGTVTVTDGIDVCQATLPATSCQISFKTAGVRTVNVSYSGDADFSGSATAVTQQVIANGADLSISKRNDRCVLPGGSRISYRIEVQNLGPEAVTNARVTDTLPSALSGATWTCSASGGASCVASGSGSIDSLVSLPNGSSVVFNLSVNVQRSPELSVSNTATVTLPTGLTDPVPGNNSSTDTDPIGIYCDGLEDPFSD